MLKPPKNFVPTPFEYHQEIELTIHDLTNLGEGVGRVDNWVVMVPFALPGERVKARVWRNKKNYSDADLVEVLEPSPDRQDPPCPIFGQCGGCQYQHYSYDRQLDWKTKQIADLIRRIGKLPVYPKIEGAEAPNSHALGVERCHGSPKQYGYRSKITPHYPRPEPGKDFPIGFQYAASRAIIDVPQCPIASDAINAALPGERQRIRDDAPLGKKKMGGTLLMRDAEEGVVTNNRATVTEEVFGKRFQFVAGEFFQNNPHILPDMVQYALDQAAAPLENGTSPRYLCDTYCGVGVFGICGADRFDLVYGVEVSDTAVKLARANAALNQVRNISFFSGESQRIFANLNSPADQTVMLIDPPRKGCDTVFLRQLFRYGPARVVYVSCGPDTQARDLEDFVRAGYMPTRIQPFDLFPQTRHIENVITLDKAM
ncbi:MAG: class I SAM-dependent RNA methyltransferase [Verrucomicrobiota bacterium JB022]|nr:class I SAM-dependent RNA methyltransferase [Verrucomicrobiota bacterium JB022]